MSASQCNYPRACPPLSLSLSLSSKASRWGARVLDRHGSAPAEAEQPSSSAFSRRRRGRDRDPGGDRRRRNHGTEQLQLVSFVRVWILVELTYFYWRSN